MLREKQASIVRLGILTKVGLSKIILILRLKCLKTFAYKIIYYRYSADNDIPSWWFEQDKNAFVRPPRTNGESTIDWLERHEVPRRGDEYVFYHATPVKNLKYIREGSYLEVDPESAKYFAARDRGIDPSKVVVHTLYLKPWQINYGIFSTLVNDYYL